MVSGDQPGGVPDLYITSSLPLLCWSYVSWLQPSISLQPAKYSPSITVKSALHCLDISLSVSSTQASFKMSLTLINYGKWSHYDTSCWVLQYLNTEISEFFSNVSGADSSLVIMVLFPGPLVLFREHEFVFCNVLMILPEIYFNMNIGEKWKFVSVEKARLGRTGIGFSFFFSHNFPFYSLFPNSINLRILAELVSNHIIWFYNLHFDNHLN